MRTKSILPAVAAGLLFATAAGAQGFVMNITGGGEFAVGTGARAEKLPDGRRRVSNGHDTKTCAADQLALAANITITIVTTKETRTYPDGIVACLDLADFGGQATFITDNGLTLKPAQPSSRP